MCQCDAQRVYLRRPVLCVKEFATDEDAIALANDSQYGLAGAVLGNDAARCKHSMSRHLLHPRLAAARQNILPGSMYIIVKYW